VADKRVLEWLSTENGRKIAKERDAFMDAMSLGLARQMKYLPPAEFETICQIAAARHSQGAGSA